MEETEEKKPVQKQTKLSALNYVNLPKKLCDLTLGVNHKPHHRMIAGTIIMILGVCFGGAFKNFHYFFFPEITEGVGEIIRAIGVVPFIDHVAHYFNEK